MESAIPDHLKRDRTQPASTPADFRPAYPAWVSRFEPLVEQVVMAYFGVQHPTKVDPAVLDGLCARFTGQYSPGYWECARYADAQGYDTVITIAYWKDVTAFAGWRGESGFDAWWREPARLADPCGYFLEVVSPTVDRFETLLSSRDQPEGIARLEDAVSGEIVEHSYWGGARDRIARSQIDPMNGETPPMEPLTETRGKRVVLPGRENLCLIRSLQDWTAMKDDEERALYFRDLQPPLLAGMRFLHEEGRTIGCLSSRFLTVLDEQGREAEKTFGLLYFDSLASLEAWAKRHPTHLAIFGSFQKYVRQMNSQIALRLYHEVTVVPAGAQQFEYLNCHPDTGMLRAGGANPACDPAALR